MLFTNVLYGFHLSAWSFVAAGRMPLGSCGLPPVCEQRISKKVESQLFIEWTKCVYLYIIVAHEIKSLLKLLKTSNKYFNNRNHGVTTALAWSEEKLEQKQFNKSINKFLGLTR